MSLYEHSSPVSANSHSDKSVTDKILFVFILLTSISILFNFIYIFYTIGDRVFTYEKAIIGYIVGLITLALLVFSLIKKNSIYFLLLAILYAICCINYLYAKNSPDGTPYYEALIFWADPNRFFGIIYFLPSIFELNLDVNFGIFEFLIPMLLFSFFFFIKRNKEKKLSSKNSSF